MPLGLGKRHAGNDVLMTTAVLLRSGMMRKYHVPFWRAVERVTPSLTLIILRKVASQLGFSLVKVVRAALRLPKRYWLDSLTKSYRKRGEARLLDRVTTSA